ncbi:MAG: hypothetical protein QF613_03975 [Candidatus Marinimicrobia bacterium]|jgi:hypothetical protein|nr:hypothetical protein [Candidatus Neomarinimicrobiota bacterium]MDP6456916.1 hypothetical protein [Candidatus Neomarinimicrobiota bacterium]MDP6593351.1 hypothetical protein [Candidatus Neomarinimicrobiota bacterium]MDP6836912.1 hypothetical protein [Candidatus Neomarinimicrobiota bacterium]MDP6966966.1 hypothetical protein [Candidatus Neomarinimicrobiota bacterium]|tara:strand:- start:96 stop:554 length:459 start_codon:yes stop_codon:yes gene_type:complete
MAKGTSFAEKAKRGLKKEKQFRVVKYVKSVVSEKTGQTRFQESLLKVPAGMSLDAYLKQLEEGPEPVVEEVTAAESVEAAPETVDEVESAKEVVPDEPDDESAEDDEPAADGASAEAEEPESQEPVTDAVAEEVTDGEPEAEPEEAEEPKSD